MQIDANESSCQICKTVDLCSFFCRNIVQKTPENVEVNGSSGYIDRQSSLSSIRRQLFMLKDVKVDTRVFQEKPWRFPFFLVSARVM